MKQCSQCRHIFLLEQFDRKKGKPRSNCKTCVSAYTKEHYKANKAYYLAKASANRVLGKRRLQMYILAYLKAHPCVDCGETDPIVLEFDHLHDKYAGISQMVQRVLSLDRIAAEIAKCEVVCSNCHKRRTAKQLHWYKNK